MTWTFDPLVRRNAYFNTVKLAARPVNYLVDFYGEMTDEINTGQGSDRLLVQWPLLAPEVVGAASGQFAESGLEALRVDAVPVLDDGGPDGPVAMPEPTDAGPVLGPSAAGHRASAAGHVLSWASAGGPRCATRWCVRLATADGPCAAAPGTGGTCWHRLGPTQVGARPERGPTARVAVPAPRSRRVERPEDARTGRPPGRGARMTESSRTSLRRVLDDLGRTVLEVVAGPAGAAAVDGPDGRVGGVVILDPLDPPLLPPRAIVLAVGVAGAGPLADLLDRAGRAGRRGPGGARTGGGRRPRSGRPPTEPGSCCSG